MPEDVGMSLMPHPNGLTNVAPEMAEFSLANARESVDFACDVMLTTMSAATAPELVRWTHRMAMRLNAIEALRAMSRTDQPDAEPRLGPEGGDRCPGREAMTGGGVDTARQGARGSRRPSLARPRADARASAVSPRSPPKG